jgi:hypothetical protein
MHTVMADNCPCCRDYEHQNFDTSIVPINLLALAQG